MGIETIKVEEEIKSSISLVLAERTFTSDRIRRRRLGPTVVVFHRELPQRGPAKLGAKFRLRPGTDQYHSLFT